VFTSYGLDKKHHLQRNCSYESNSQVTRTCTEFVSMRTAVIGIHDKRQTGVYWNPYMGTRIHTHVYVNTPLHYVCVVAV